MDTPPRLPRRNRPRHHSTHTLAVTLALALAATAVGATSAAAATPTPAPTPIPATAAPACTTPAPHHVKCFAEIRTTTPPTSTATPHTAPVLFGLPPATLQAAYGMSSSPNAGAGQTVAIVDAYGDSTLTADLATFDAQYGLPACGATCLTQVSETGTSTLPANDSSWSVETSLDVETVHAMAPGAKILLVEAASTWDNDMFAAQAYAVAHARYVSSSWGEPEQLGLIANDAMMSAPGVSVFFASGDTGAEVDYPAVAPNVISVGGTTLHTDLSGNVTSESAWSRGGGGCSVTEHATPAQLALSSYAQNNCGGFRATPDIAADADPMSGVSIVDSQMANGNGGWLTVGGTSLSSPLVAAQAADAGTVVDPAAVYGNSLILRDITTGSNGYPARPGFDLATGRGAILSRATSTTTLAASTTAPTNYGTGFTLTASVTAPGVTTPLTGTVMFSSSINGPLCTSTLTGNQAQCVLSAFALSSGTHTITATYSGSSSAGPSSGVTPWGVSGTPPGDGKGYWMASSDAGVFAYGDAGFYGSMGGQHLNQPVVSMAPTPTGRGYWLVARDGGIFSFGDAAFYGSTGAMHLNQPIVGMASTPDGRGYWLVASDGGIFAFGDATFYGSMGGSHLNKPITAMAAAPGGRGYWMVASDGGVFAFGDAPFHGSMGATPPPSPITNMTATPSGQGYLFVTASGGVYAYGDAVFAGAPDPRYVFGRVVAITTSHSGHGYWVAESSGVVLSFGDAGFYPSAPSSTIVALAS